MGRYWNPGLSEIIFAFADKSSSGSEAVFGVASPCDATRAAPTDQLGFGGPLATGGAVSLALDFAVRRLRAFIGGGK